MNESMNERSQQVMPKHDHCRYNTVNKSRFYEERIFFSSLLLHSDILENIADFIHTIEGES